MICAKDVMSKGILTVKKNTGIKDAIRLLVENNITGLPVVSDDMQLLGMVSEKDILRALYDRNIKSRSVADLMTTEVVCFDENDDLVKVFESLMESNFRRVPILSEGELVGIVSRRDIIKFLFKSTQQKEDVEQE